MIWRLRPAGRFSCLTTVFAMLALHAGAAEPSAVHFNAADGMRLAADYYPPRAAARSAAPVAPMVILLHERQADRTAWEPLVGPLHRAGFAVLAIDLRGHGGSATTASRERVRSSDRMFFRQMQADLRGAYDWLATQPGVHRARFALVGAGVGCSVALQYAAKDRSVDAIVCLSPVLKDMGLDAAGDVRQIRGRKLLLLATGEDRDAAFTLQKATEGAHVHHYPDRDEVATSMLGAIPEIEDEIVSFLRKSVGRPTKTTVYGSIERNIYHFADSGWLQRISPTNLRYYSSPVEAESRGLRAARSKGPGRNRARGADRDVRN